MFYSIENAAKECKVSKRTLWRKIDELEIKPMVVRNNSHQVGRPMRAYLTKQQLDQIKEAPGRGHKTS